MTSTILGHLKLLNILNKPEDNIKILNSRIQEITKISSIVRI